MKIGFKNLGPLHDCKVELGDLTIVTGHNNTGKTYVTYGVFGLLASWRHLTPMYYDGVVDQLYKGGQILLNLQSHTGTAGRQYLHHLARNYQASLPRVLAGERERFADTKVSLELSSYPQIEQMKFDVRQVLPSGVIMSITKPPEELSAVVCCQPAPNLPELDAETKYGIATWLNETLTELIFQPYFPRVFIASTERTGAAIFQRELYLGRNRLIEMFADLKPGEIPDMWTVMQRMASSYAMPVQQNVEFLSHANLEAVQRQQGFLAEERPDILEALEDLTGGTYKASKDGTYFTPKKSRGLKLRLGESSSAARSLLDVNFYIRHVLRPGDCFMIDEPELNLHPKNQRKFARLVGRLINAGVKVFLTTHSDYIIRELNTLILLHARKDAQKKLLSDLGYDSKELIPASGVRFYRTTEDRRKLDGASTKKWVTVLEEVKVTDTTGIEVESFDEEIDELNNVQDKIVYAPEPAL